MPTNRKRPDRLEKGEADEVPSEEQGATALLPTECPKSPMHKCCMCTYGTNSLRKLTRHMLRSHSGRVYKCTLCGATTTSYEETRSHRYWALMCLHAKIAEIASQLGRIRISGDESRVPERRDTPVRRPPVRALFNPESRPPLGAAALPPESWPPDRDEEAPSDDDSDEAPVGS